MRLKRSGMYYYNDAVFLCANGMEEVFGPLGKEIEVIVSKRPLKGSKCFKLVYPSYAERGGDLIPLTMSAVLYLRKMGATGRFYVKVTTCN